MTVSAMKAARRWLLASPEKVPHYVDGSRRSGHLDTPQDVKRLASCFDAKAALEKAGSGWHLGFALGLDGAGGYWQGIDFDAIEDNLLNIFVDSLPSYVETSPSGKGLHAIGYGRQFDALGPNGSGIEAYCAGRYFTFTDNVIRDDLLVCLADHVETVLAGPHKSLSHALISGRSNISAENCEVTQVSAETVADLRSALLSMRADDYGHWIDIGHALKGLGNIGRGLWLEWSTTSQKFDAQQAAAKWDGFAPTETNYRAVFAKAQALGWINPASNSGPINSASIGQAIIATPYRLVPAADIPPRPWVFGRWLLRGTVTTIIAPGGVGKSALTVTAALAMASGTELIGKTVWSGPKRVWLWNLEDDGDELSRQIAASVLHHELADEDYAQRLFVNDAASALCTATKGRDGLTINLPVNLALAREIHARQIDVLIIDPFVSSHRADENDNGQIDAIAKQWASIARETHCSVILVHHSRKMGGQLVDADAARGASALGNAARTVLVLNRMDKTEASRLGVADEDRRRYFRVSNDKSNRAPAEQGDWFRLVSVPLANGGPDGGDSVGVVERWIPPEFSILCDNTVLAKIQAEISTGKWRSHISASDWVGHAISKVIGADLLNLGDKQRVKALLKNMLAKGQLCVEQQPDASRHLRPFVVAGELVAVECDSPAW